MGIRTQQSRVIYKHKDCIQCIETIFTSWKGHGRLPNALTNILVPEIGCGSFDEGAIEARKEVEFQTSSHCVIGLLEVNN